MRKIFCNWRRNVGVMTLGLATLSQSGCATFQVDPWHPFIFTSGRITTDERQVPWSTLMTILVICVLCAGIVVAHPFRSRKK